VILQPSALSSRHDRKAAWALAPLAPALLAAALAAVDARRSFTLAEVERVLGTRHAWRSLVPFDPADPSGALYQVALKGWLHAGGQEWVTRAPSVAAVALTAIVVALLGARLFDRTVGLVAGTIFATTASIAGLGRTVDPVPLAVLAATVATWLFVCALESGSISLWGLYVVTTVASVYLHASALTLLGAHALAAALAPGRMRRRGAVALAAAIAGSFPAAIPIVLHRRHAVDALVQPSAADVGRAVHDAVGRNGVLLGLAAVGVLALLLRPLPRAEPWKTTLLATAAALPLAGALALSMVRPSLDARYLAVSVPAWSLLAAAGFRTLRREVGVLALAALLALAGLRLADVVRRTPENWRAAVATAFAARQPEDRVVVAPGRAISAFAFYAGPDRGSLTPKGPATLVVVRAPDAAGAIAAGRASVQPPAYALRDIRRLGGLLWLQRWERTGLPAG